MELKHLNTHRLINQKVFHPLYGEIGKVKNLLDHKGIKYVVFRERSMHPEQHSTLRAIPVKLFYKHEKTGELRVNFGAQWITEAPVFTPADLDYNYENVKLTLVEYYQKNTLWMGKLEG